MQEFTSIPAIAVLCGFIGELFKSIPNYDNKYIPIVCSLAGLVLGVVCFYLFPGYISADNVMVAAVIGIVSGGYSTTSHQMYKQLTQVSSAKD